MMGVKGNKTLLFYMDEGPIGPCGQEMSITSPWKQLHIFDSHREALEWADRILKQKGRRNRKVFIVEPEQMYNHCKKDCREGQG